MVTTTDVLRGDELERLVRERADQFAVPDTELEIEAYREPAKQIDVVRVTFRTSDPMQKYGAEVACDIQNTADQQLLAVKRKVDEQLQALESRWLEECGNVTFYKNHGFFYQFTRVGSKASLEVKCTVCNHVESVEYPREILDEYRDMFLLKMLPEAHAKCGCAAGRYAPVSRPRMHGL